MGELAIVLAILCGVWAYVAINDPTMEPDAVSPFVGLVGLALFFGALTAGIAAALQ